MEEGSPPPYNNRLDRLAPRGSGGETRVILGGGEVDWSSLPSYTSEEDRLISWGSRSKAKVGRQIDKRICVFLVESNALLGRRKYGWSGTMHRL